MRRAAPFNQKPAAWRKNRDAAREGFKDLAYLPHGRAAWNCTLAAQAFAARRDAFGSADLNLWAVMHGVPAGRLFAEAGGDALVLWHGTSAVRAKQIREHGLFRQKRVWAARNPRIAHGYTRARSQEPALRTAADAEAGAGSAVVVLVLRLSEWEGRMEAQGPEIVALTERVPRECVQYILFDDRIEFLGEKAASRRVWGAGRFARREGRWEPISRPPVRLDETRSYLDFAGWLDASLRRIFATLGPAAAVEVFSSLYATLSPRDALTHNEVFDALDRLCGPPRIARKGVRLFRLLEGETAQ